MDDWEVIYLKFDLICSWMVLVVNFDVLFVRSWIDEILWVIFMVDCEIGLMWRKGFVIKVDGCNLELMGLESEESGFLDCLKEDESDCEIGIGVVVFSI